MSVLVVRNGVHHLIRSTFDLATWCFWDRVLYSPGCPCTPGLPVSASCWDFRDCFLCYWVLFCYLALVQAFLSLYCTFLRNVICSHWYNVTLMIRTLSLWFRLFSDHAWVKKTTISSYLSYRVLKIHMPVGAFLLPVASLHFHWLNSITDYLSAQAKSKLAKLTCFLSSCIQTITRVWFKTLTGLQCVLCVLPSFSSTPHLPYLILTGSLNASQSSILLRAERLPCLSLALACCLGLYCCLQSHCQSPQLSPGSLGKFS